MPPNARGRPATAALDARTEPTDTNEASITPAAVAQLLKRSDERELHLRRLLAAEYEAFERGREVGYVEGRPDEADERDKAWNAIAAAVIHGLPFDELERCRWGPDGREHFADPGPDDYPGRGGAAA